MRVKARQRAVVAGPGHTIAMDSMAPDPAALATPATPPTPELRPLSPRWLDAIEALAPQLLGPDDRQGAALAAEIRALSELYNQPAVDVSRAQQAMAARLRFFLPRDLPKLQGPLLELHAAGLLPPGPRWRVLDLGAGVGASTLGLSAFAAQLDKVESLDVLACDHDARALDIMAGLSARAGKGALAAVSKPVALECKVADLTSLRVRGDFDIIVVGLALNELFRDAASHDRLHSQLDWLARAAGRLRPDASMIVVEPAHRRTSRQLSALRDALLDPGAAAGALSVFAPCLTDRPCPLLRRPRDWCHDQLDLALPERLSDLARAAGLRARRLTYAYLTLRRDGHRLRDRWPGDAPPLRVVGGPLASKGKVEWEACGQPGLVRLRRLDREAGGEQRAVEGAARGTVLRVDAPLVDGGHVRLRPEVGVERLLR